ncbi:hypothetical protein SCUP515_01695 [Seiridium cupressi]
MLLTEHALENMDSIANEAEARHNLIKNSIEDAKGTLETMRESLSTHTSGVSNTRSILRLILDMVSVDIMASLNSTIAIVTKICLYAQRIYELVLEIRSHMAPAPGARWNFFQAPVILEDALGRKLSVPSEYDLYLLNMIILHKSKDGLGSAEVCDGDYEIFDTKTPHSILTSEVALKPGSSIMMTIIVPQTYSCEIWLDLST